MSSTKTPSTTSVHDHEFIPEELAEEEAIMAERAARPKALDSHTLKVPIRVLDLQKAETVKIGASVAETVEVMQKGRFGAVLVTGKDGKLAGIFTERDVLLKLAGKGKDWKKETVDTWMTSKVESLPDSASLAFALNMMTEGGYRHVPIVDKDSKPLSVLSIKDAVRYLCSFFEKEVKNLPPRPGLLHPTKDGG
jgi:CBS domain-containing protein